MTNFLESRFNKVQERKCLLLDINKKMQIDGRLLLYAAHAIRNEMPNCKDMLGTHRCLYNVVSIAYYGKTEVTMFQKYDTRTHTRHLEGCVAATVGIIEACKTLKLDCTHIHTGCDTVNPFADKRTIVP